jgi:hypothetical protein
VELLSAGTVLGRRRILLLLAGLAAVVATGRLPAGPGSTTAAGPTGVAQARIMLDHPAAYVADLGLVADPIGAQARLLADVVAGDGAGDAIARRAGLAPSQVGMQRMQFGELFALGQLPERGALAAATVARPYIVNVWAATPLPILTIDVLAPSAADAARVADATRKTLEALVATRAPSAERGVVMRELGEVRAVPVAAQRRSPLVGIAVALVAFAFACAGIVVLDGLGRAWRRLTPAPASADGVGRAGPG